ncbi:MAG: DMT family transporter [Betaproteobacteria bacterium]|nr:DMT family transporter [Betaproteobacteria bacterium]NBT10819.1 DMT family transporter [Betaproteobacteria bacterium]NBU48785.1 DMT family transporter [Betaproteobacteria bacterium]NBX96172.1 DMT family transporter [Betaproteobacteria bacterium]
MAPTQGLAASALVLNALVWGLSWWPFRHLDEQGLHPLWATTLVYAAISALLLAARPRSVVELLRPSALWVLVAAAGTTNAAFNWAVSIGDVVRVVLLFYLMPLWAVLLARWLLNEAVTPRALLRVALGLAGAVIVLWPEGGKAHASPFMAAFSLSDALAIVGGFSFALNNIMVRREQARSEAARAAAMFIGGALIAGVVGLALQQAGSVPAPRWDAAAQWWPWALGLSAAFLAANLSLQYGASRLPAHRTAVIMLTEVLFASASAVALGAGTLGPALLVGGACILASAWLAAWD